MTSEARLVAISRTTRSTLAIVAESRRDAPAIVARARPARGRREFVDAEKGTTDADASARVVRAPATGARVEILSSRTPRIARRVLGMRARVARASARAVAVARASSDSATTSWTAASRARAFGASARASGAVPRWATADPWKMSAACGGPALGANLVRGTWRAVGASDARATKIVDPMNASETETFVVLPSTNTKEEIDEVARSLASCPKSGLHNAFKAPERYVAYGAVAARLAEEFRKPEVEEYFARLIQRVAPKSHSQALAEVIVTRKFLENFAGDNVRFLARGFSVSGDHLGQQSHGLRWPYGPVSVITPFNFPLEIPVLQLMGALFMGNKALVKSDSKVSIVLEQYIRLLLECGAPATDFDFIHCDGKTMNEILSIAKPKMTLFTGSQKVAHHLAKELGGNVKLEDAGFDWKILGPDVGDVDYVAHVCDQDAYACSGQKCSAQSILFMHRNWVDAGIEAKIATLASERKLEDLTVGPVLTLTTKTMLEHAKKLAALPGARIAFGGKELNGGNHAIPAEYGAIEPTAVFVPLETIMASEENFRLVTTEIFGPFQVLTSYETDQLPLVLDACERMDAHLTAAVVSSDELFTQRVLGATVNGTTYAGRRARTTGAPQNHWFGPAGTPMAGGIGTIEAIQLVWSCHREVIFDRGPIASDWRTPPRA